MSKKKKLIFLAATTCILGVLATLGCIVYLNTKPRSGFAQLLRHHGVPLESVLNQAQVSAVSHKLADLIPGMKAEARGTATEEPAVSPAVFNTISIKGVIGASSDGTALVSADGKTRSVKVGDQFLVKSANGSVTLCCETIRPDLVVLSVARSNLRKEYALR